MIKTDPVMEANHLLGNCPEARPRAPTVGPVPLHKIRTWEQPTSRTSAHQPQEAAARGARTQLQHLQEQGEADHQTQHHPERNHQAPIPRPLCK
jgi:hypothetical protein